MMVNVQPNMLTSSVYMYVGVPPSRHAKLRQRRINVDATSWRCVDVDVTLYKRHVPAGLTHLWVYLIKSTMKRS